MLKLRSVHIFLLALTMLLGAVVDRGFHISSINITSSEIECCQDLEDLGAETKYYPVLLSFLKLNPRSQFVISDSEITFDHVKDFNNLSLPQLLGSHRIALPPPSLV